MTHDWLSRRELLKGVAKTAAIAAVPPPIGARVTRMPGYGIACRVRTSFDSGWKFLRGDAPGAEAVSFVDSDWRSLDLPHDWSVEGPFDEKAPAGATGGYLPTGIGWYRKHFRLPDSYEGKKVTIGFDGVYQLSEVWINGQYLGKRPYGYVPFFYDLTAYVKFGSEHVLAVRVDNSHQTNCRWYSGSGIYRHTWLLVTSKVHISHWGTFISTPEVQKEAAAVRARTKVRNEDRALVHCTLITSVFDQNGRVVAKAEANQDMSPGAEHEFVQPMSVANPNLWSVAGPYMYNVHSTVKVQNEVLDEYDTPFGIRSGVFDADRGFLLNGERIKINGVCLHHDGGCMGAAVPERVWERRMEILKEMGCNAIRTSHNPPAEEFLSLCDRMGFLVMDEAFDEWRIGKGQIGPNGYARYFDEWYERDVENLVRRDRNHPSVVLWSAGNEIGDQDVPEGAETLAKILKVFHDEDPTRLVTAGCDHIAADPPDHRARPEFLALLDVVGYNYADRWRDRREKYYSVDRETFPQRRMIGTESTSMGGVRGEYPEISPPPGAPPFFQFLRGRNVDVEQLWKFVRDYDYVAGDFMWTGIDHLGEAFWPNKGSSSGVVDTCGFKKDGFYFYQSQWTNTPVLHMFPHWNWKGREGQIIPVTCFTNCDTVELFVNGTSWGVKGYEFPRVGMELRWGNLPERARTLRTTGDLHLSWDVPYHPGTIKMVGTINGRTAASAEIATTGEPARLEASLDREAILADGRDLVHLTIQVLDDQGRVVPTATNPVTLSLDGVGKLIGMDNGDPRSHEDFRSNCRKAFNGMCLAIVQSNGKEGQIQMKVSSPSIQEAVVVASAKGPAR